MYLYARGPCTCKCICTCVITCICLFQLMEALTYTYTRTWYRGDEGPAQYCWMGRLSARWETRPPPPRTALTTLVPASPEAGTVHYAQATYPKSACASGGACAGFSRGRHGALREATYPKSACASGGAGAGFSRGRHGALRGPAIPPPANTWTG